MGLVEIADYCGFLGFIFTEFTWDEINKYL
jgi:hypothetical protein